MILLNGSSLTLEALLAIADDYQTVRLAPDAAARVDSSRAVVDRQALGDAPIYGINTGFGALAESAIARDSLGALQVNLLRSHAAGVGEPRCERGERSGERDRQHEHGGDGHDRRRAGGLGREAGQHQDAGAEDAGDVQRLQMIEALIGEERSALRERQEAKTMDGEGG